MTAVLYLDVYFAVNFFMDFLLLLLVRKILGICAENRRMAPGRTMRLAAAAAAGAFWACAEAVIRLPGEPCFWKTAASWAGAGAVMTALAFGWQSPGEGLRCLADLWISGAAAGGVLEAVEEAAGRAGGSGRFPLEGVIFGGLGIFFCGRAGAGYLQQRFRMQNRICQAVIRYRGKTKTLPALWDTGNTLYEPYGHQPVHVMSPEAGRELFEPLSRVIYIPFRSVGTSYGLIPGIQADEMEIWQNGKLVKTCIRPWIAVSREPLSSCHQYEMLLHGEQ